MRTFAIAGSLVMCLIFGTIAVGHAGYLPDSSSSGVDVYSRASARTGVPVELLAAIAGAESGWHPWAINLKGKAHYCASREEALELAEVSDDVDLGLMQINYRFWGKRLGLNKTQLIDPATNVEMGARIIADLAGPFSLSEPKSPEELWRLLEAYHSSHGNERVRWAKRVYRSYQYYLSLWRQRMSLVPSLR